MPQRLKARQEKIQERRKHTPWREFVMEICVYRPLMYYHHSAQLTEYPETSRVTFPLVHREQYENAVDGNYNVDVVFDGDFFATLSDLRSLISEPLLFQIGNNENTSYASYVANSKNVYLSNTITDGENVLYSLIAKGGVHNVLNSLMVWDNCANVYSSIGVFQSSDVFFSHSIDSSSFVWFSSNLTGCDHCFMCQDLTNQSYHIKNKPYNKEEYIAIVSQVLADQKEKFLIPRPSATSDGVIMHSANIEDGIFVYNTKNAKNIYMCGGNDDCENVFDSAIVGIGGVNHIYACQGVGFGAEHIYCSQAIIGGNDIYYSIHLDRCSYCLGCIGLKNKSYCIFNKQYTKEERYNKVDEIFSQMEIDGILGQFFPGSMNPFYFNDTAAYLIDDTFTKEEVTAKGYLWRDEPIKVDIPAGATVVKTNELDKYEGFVISTEVERSTVTKPRFLDAASLHSKGHDKEVVWYIDPEILKVIIQDEQGNVYRIVQMEYDFLMKHGLPLPRKHRLERMKANFSIVQ